MEKIRIGIVGYGNLGRGVELAVAQTKDMTVDAVFSRRAPETIKTFGASVYSIDEAINKQDDLDVLILCGGSANDLPQQTPYFAQYLDRKSVV